MSNTIKQSNIYTVKAFGEIIQINVYFQNGNYIASGGGIRGITTSIASAHDAAIQFVHMIKGDIDTLVEYDMMATNRG